MYEITYENLNKSVVLADNNFVSIIGIKEENICTSIYSDECSSGYVVTNIITNVNSTMPNDVFNSVVESAMANDLSSNESISQIALLQEITVENDAGATTVAYLNFTDNEVRFQEKEGLFAINIPYTEHVVVNNFLSLLSDNVWNEETTEEEFLTIIDGVKPDINLTILHSLFEQYFVEMETSEASAINEMLSNEDTYTLTQANKISFLDKLMNLEFDDEPDVATEEYSIHEKLKSPALLITHKNSRGICTDGFGCHITMQLFAAENNFWFDTLAYSYDEVDTFDVSVCEDKLVLIADFSFPIETIEEIASVAKGLVVLDHHASAISKNRITESIYCSVDTEKSGSVLLWEYLFEGRELPEILYEINEHDLGRFSEDTVRATDSFLVSHYSDIADDKFPNIWERLHAVGITNLLNGNYKFLPYDYQDHLNRVKDLNTYYNIIIEDLMIKGEDKVYKMGDKEVLLLSDMISYNTLSQLIYNNDKLDFPYVGFIKFKDGKVKVALRCRQDLSIVEVAESFGGGGHPCAAGLSIPISKFDMEAYVNNRVFKLKDGIPKNYTDKVDEQDW